MAGRGRPKKQDQTVSNYDGMNQQEVADELGITRAAVQQIERRAYKKFRKELAKRLTHITDLL